ncbi:Regucalcin [Orchesella cincta]|uniref:Regucalcin n=1 Tax=Orchesella cincta TaxID=48709 RepID=A0A1D2NDD8_ORCCI|nr:Regucalcin [Orchesella cincta]
MSGYKIEAIAGAQRTYLGEGPHWNAQKNELLYVDIFGKAVHRYVPSTGENAKVTVDAGPVSLVVPVEGQPNKYLITVERDVQVMEWDGVSAKPTSLKRLYTVDDHCKTNRINDGKCDASGRLWAGTMGYEPAPGQLDPKKGTLYSFGLDGSVVKHADQIDIANGLAWTSDNSIFYYIDSFSYRVDAFDFDITSGVLSNRRTAFDFKANGVDGIPDGMTIDANGNLWVAVFAGKKVVHIDPKVGKKIGQLDFPTTNITSVTFGGPNLDILYATCAEHFLSKEDLASQTTAGSVFQVLNVGARGLAPGFNYKGPV